MALTDLEVLLESVLNFWGQLPDSEKEMIKSSVSVRNYKPGVIINDSTGIDSPGLHILKNGKLRVFISSPEGYQLTLKHIFDNEVLTVGASSVLNMVIFDVSIEIESECDLILIPRATFKRLYDTYPVVKISVINTLAVLFSDTLQLLESVVFTSVASRLAKTLIEKSRLEKSHMFNTTHAALASDIGTAREVVTRLLDKLKKNGIVTLKRGKILINDMKRLADIRNEYFPKGSY